MSVDIKRLQDEARAGDPQAAKILATIAQRSGDPKLSWFLEGVREHQREELQKLLNFWSTFSTGASYIIQLHAVDKPPTIVLVKVLVSVVQDETGVGWHLAAAKLAVDRMKKRGVPLVVPVLFSKRERAQNQLQRIVGVIDDVQYRQGHVKGHVKGGIHPFDEEHRKSLLALHRALYKLRQERLDGLTREDQEIAKSNPNDGWGWDIWQSEKF